MTSYISKNILQCSQYVLPSYVTDMIKMRSNGWNYYYFSQKTMVEFIKNNPLEGIADTNEFDNAIDVFIWLEKEYLRYDFFTYYFLYVKGGIYIDSYAMLEEDIDVILSNHFYPNTRFFSVKSITSSNTMFNGFIGSESKNIIIYRILKYIFNLYNEDKKNIEQFVVNNTETNNSNNDKSNNKQKIISDPFIFSKELTVIIAKHLAFLIKYSKSPDIKIFTEKKYDENRFIVVDKVNNINNTNNNETSEIKLLTHYFTKTPIVPILPFENRRFKSIEETKIGITFNMPENILSLFTNGIKQNVLYFTELLVNIGYNCSLIVNPEIDTENPEKYKSVLYDDRFKLSKLSNILIDDFDIVFILGFELTNSIINQLKLMKTKIVAYFCGNSYIIESEKILYSQHKNITSFNYTPNQLYDVIWTIPQHTNSNKYYWETLYRTSCIEVPFIWSDKTITLFSKEKNIDFCYKNIEKVKEENKNKIAIFEPNISIIKWCIPPLLICENAYRIKKNIENRQINTESSQDNINKVYLTNVTDKNKNINDFNLEYLNKFVKSLDLFIDKKMFIESRHNTLMFMCEAAHIAVSHQWENPLNYLYLDLAWMGWPVIHNAHLCKDIGYYYEGFNYEEGANVLVNVMENHDKNIDLYIEQNREKIDRYLPSNLELQEKYKILIKNLF